MTRTEFETLYSDLAPRLRSFIARQVGSPDLAADLLQDTFLRLLRAPPGSVNSRPEITAYLYRTAHSVVIDHFRREQRARWWRLLERQPSPPRAAPSAFDETFRQLSPRERTLLWLAYVEEMSHAEIAKILDVAPGSVKVMLFRARQRLAAALKEKEAFA